MYPEGLPDTAEYTDDGWTIDLAGVADPKPNVPVVAGALVAVALLVGLVATWWLVLPFLAVAAVTANPRGGDTMHGFAVRAGALEVFGLGRIPLQHVKPPRLIPAGLALVIDGQERELHLEGESQDWAWVAERIAEDVKRHGDEAEVPEKLAALQAEA